MLGLKLNLAIPPEMMTTILVNELVMVMSEPKQDWNRTDDARSRNKKMRNTDRVEHQIAKGNVIAIFDCWDDGFGCLS